MQKNITHVIQSNFDRSFFLQQESVKTIYNIQQAVSTFHKRYPNFEQKLYDALKERFSNAIIENYTQFFNNDRCVRFLVQVSLQERYVMQASIFGFFSIYKHSATFDDRRYHYSDVLFINSMTLKDADEIYKCLPKGSSFEWLTQTQLIEIIPEFSVMNDDVRFQYLTTVADVLFTKHYI